jgi:hypothetical protein
MLNRRTSLHLREHVASDHTGLVGRCVRDIVGLDQTELLTCNYATLRALIPFDIPLPTADLLITNDGYRPCNRHQICVDSLVVAGDTEDKAFVAAPVNWTEQELTEKPRPDQIPTEDK